MNLLIKLFIFINIYLTLGYLTAAWEAKLNGNDPEEKDIVCVLCWPMLIIPFGAWSLFKVIAFIVDGEEL